MSWIASLSRGLPRWMVGLILVVGVALIALFGIRMLNQLDYSRKVQSGEIQVETLRGWMTLPYIARAYGVEETDPSHYAGCCCRRVFRTQFA